MTFNPTNKQTLKEMLNLSHDTLTRDVALRLIRDRAGSKLSGKALDLLETMVAKSFHHDQPDIDIETLTWDRKTDTMMGYARVKSRQHFMRVLKQLADAGVIQYEVTPNHIAWTFHLRQMLTWPTAKTVANQTAKQRRAAEAKRIREYRKRKADEPDPILEVLRESSTAAWERMMKRAPAGTLVPDPVQQELPAKGDAPKQELPAKVDHQDEPIHDEPIHAQTVQPVQPVPDQRDQGPTFEPQQPEMQREIDARLKKACTAARQNAAPIQPPRTPRFPSIDDDKD